MTRDDLFELLATASDFGHLGFFVGSGFSIAACGDNAPSWLKLLQLVNDRLNIGFNFEDVKDVRGLSFPQLATVLVDRISDKGLKGVPKNDRTAARLRLLQEVSVLCCFGPMEESREKLAQAFYDLSPHWFITTNYDLVIEQILKQRSVVLSASGPLVPRTDPVPVYHLHGHRLDPQGLVLLEEDYVRLFAPAEYRQLALALTLSESTTVMLGYGRGDINVRSAIEWSHSFLANGEPHSKFSDHQGCIVQALFSSSPNPEPYKDDDGIIIIETDDLPCLLSEMANAVKSYKDKRTERARDLKAWLMEPSSAVKLSKSSNHLNRLSEEIPTIAWSLPPHQIVDFLQMALEPSWEAARRNGAFDNYDPFLRVLLHFLKSNEVELVHPRVVAFLCKELARISPYINPKGKFEVGKSKKASKRWKEESPDIGPKMYCELQAYARFKRDTSLLGILK